LGLRRAPEGRDAAYWASWADTLPILHQRHPSVVAEAIRRVQLSSLEGTDEATPNLAELAKAAVRLQEAGFALPAWDELADGGHPPPALVERTLGEPLRGWQRAAAACLDASACTSLLSDLDPASRALMLFQAGPGGSRALTALPTTPKFRLSGSCFRVVLLRRLRLPVPIGPRRCGGALDALGDHRTACPAAGVLGARGAALERAAARVCREAGARGARPAVDTTLVSRVTRAGDAQPHADRVPGTALEQAAKRKRWRPEAVAFSRQLAKARSRETPARLHPAVRLHCWTGMLALAAQRALAYSLLELPLAAADKCDGTEPPLGDLLVERGGNSALGCDGESSGPPRNPGARGGDGIGSVSREQTQDLHHHSADRAELATNFDADNDEDTSPDQTRSRRSLSRNPSSDILFVDIDEFLAGEGLIYHELQPLETIDEAVGFATSHWTGQGSMLSCVFTLVASAMGAGCLSLPHMFSKTGIVCGLTLLACGALLAHVSLVILMSCARYTQCRSFAELVSLSEAEPSDGRSGRNPLVDTVIMFYGMAAVLIYMMLIGDFFADIAQSPLFGYADVPRQHLILASLICVFPLSIPRNVTALRYISVLSTSVIVFLTIVVVAKMPSCALTKPAAEPRVLEENGPVRTILQSFAMALFSFNAHTNAVPVAMALDQPRAARIWQVSLLSVLIEFGIYSTIATAGYLSFGGLTKQDFIRNYPPDDSWMLLVRCVYSVPVIFGVPINLSPAAASIQALAGRIFSSKQQFRRQTSDPHPNSARSQCRRACIVGTVLLCSALLAICCEAFADVIGLFGACFGTAICLMWPLRKGKENNDFHWLQWALWPPAVSLVSCRFATLLGWLSPAMSSAMKASKASKTSHGGSPGNASPTNGSQKVVGPNIKGSREDLMLDASDEGELKGWGGGVLRARELDVLELCFEIEEYQLVMHLQSALFGGVYEAKGRSSGKDYAIKVLHKSELQKVEENDSIEFCEVPLSELKFADVMKGHEHVMEVEEHFEDQYCHYCVFELCRG
ncbi:slc38a7, partial [Symbiodinium necroappetens]